MPKQRPPFDVQRYEAFKAKGLSQRAIAEQMGMPEATCRIISRFWHRQWHSLQGKVYPWTTKVYSTRSHAIRLGNLEGDLEVYLRETMVYLNSVSTQVYLTMVRAR